MEVNASMETFESPHPPHRIEISLEHSNQSQEEPHQSFRDNKPELNILKHTTLSGSGTAAVDAAYDRDRAEASNLDPGYSLAVEARYHSNH